MRRDVFALVAIVAVALTIRVYAPWRDVFAEGYVNFLENDAWYHVRLIENQVRNWPWRVTVDPYAAPGGQFVPIAPLFDTLTSTVVFAGAGRDASTSAIERIAAFVPPILGGLAVVFAWLLARTVFDRTAALMAAGLLAVLPGHFLDRTLLGFYDHHALEALLALATLWGLATGSAVRTGVFLGLYLLGWSSGAFFAGILGAGLIALVPIVRSPEELARTARVLGVAAVIALALVLLFQDPRMYRYGSQLVALVGIVATAFAIRVASARPVARFPAKTVIYGAIAVVIGSAAAVVWWTTPDVLAQLIGDMSRLRPDPRRMGVLEARPLFWYSGHFRWQQPWEFFRLGFFAGAIGLIAFAGRIWRERRAVDVLLWIFGIATFVATIGQNRFGYYMVPMAALFGGWFASGVLIAGLKSRATSRATTDAQLGASVARDFSPAITSPAITSSAIVLFVAAAMILPNLTPSALAAARSGSLPPHWRDAMLWLKDHSAAPFDPGDSYYYARYPAVAPSPGFSIMNWWDHGYWITQIARRVPVSNPTQERASIAGRFYASTDEHEAGAIVDRERARYVLADWELPFRLTPEGAIMGRFQNVVDWAGGEHARYYEVYYRREDGDWTPVWVFHQPYYQSMAYRLMVLGGAAARPANSTSVLVVVDRSDPAGLPFREVVSQMTFATYEAALQAAQLPTAVGRTIVAGLDPWQPAFPVERVTTMRQLHESRSRDQKPTEAPRVRVFEVFR